MEVHDTMTSRYMLTSRGTTHELAVLKTTVLMVFCSVLCIFRYLCQHIQILQLREKQLCIGLKNKFLIRYDANNDWRVLILSTVEAHFKLNTNVNN